MVVIKSCKSDFTNKVYETVIELEKDEKVYTKNCVYNEIIHDDEFKQNNRIVKRI